MDTKIFDEPQATLATVTSNGQSNFVLQVNLGLCGRCFADLPLAVIVGGGDLEEFIARAIGEAVKKHVGPSDVDEHEHKDGEK